MFLLLLSTFAYFSTAAIIFGDEVKNSILSVIFFNLLFLLVYWSYRITKWIKDEKLRITKIMIMSKDGYEPEITRVQSKRNLFKFIKTYFTKETNFVAHPEEYWWKKQLTFRKQDISDILKKFIENNKGGVMQQEEFAYEGIFDKKEQQERSPIKLNNSRRMDASNIVGTLNKSKLADEEIHIKHNGSHVIQMQDEISDRSLSPNSANANAFSRRSKKNAITRDLNKSPFDMTLSRAKPKPLFNLYDHGSKKVTDSTKINKLDMYRSAKEIKVARLQTRKGSGNIDGKMTNKLVEEVQQKKINNIYKKNTEKTRHNSIPVNSYNSTDSGNLLVPDRKGIISHNKSPDSNTSENTGKFEKSENNYEIKEPVIIITNETQRSNQISMQNNMSEPLPIGKLGASDAEEETNKSNQTKDKIEVEPLDKIHPKKRDSEPIPLNTSNEEQKIPNSTKRNSKEDLGIIPEEQHSGSYSTIIQFTQSRQKGLTIQ